MILRARRTITSIATGRRPTFVTLSDFFFETIPLGFLGVAVFLSRILVLAARPPVLIARSIARLRPIAAPTRVTIISGWLSPLALSIAIGSGTFPATLAAAHPQLTRSVARLEQLTAFEPLHHRRLVLLP